MFSRLKKVILSGIPAIWCLSLSFGASVGNSEAATSLSGKRRLHVLSENMEIVRSHVHRNISPNDAVHTLPLYRSPPRLEVRLEDFELYAMDRLRVLKGISDGLSRGKKPEEMDQLVYNLWKTHMRHQHASEFVNKDIISHFVLRLVYCRTEDLRKWFLSMETSLFRYRFRRENAETQRAIMAEFDLPYKAVNHVEFESVKDKLEQVARSIGQPLRDSRTKTLFFFSFLVLSHSPFTS